MANAALPIAEQIDPAVRRKGDVAVADRSGKVKTRHVDQGSHGHDPAAEAAIRLCGARQRRATN